MRKLIFLGLCIIVVLTSCVNTKKLGTVIVYSEQDIYKNYYDGDSIPPISKLITGTTKNTKAQIKEENNHLKIKLIEEEKTCFKESDTVDYKKAGYDYYYYPKLEDTLNTWKFKYLEISPVFQAISTPFKVRFSTDSIPYQVSTSVNLGLSYGWKFTHKSYRNHYHNSTFLNKRTNSISFTPAIFCGPSTIDLNSKNTKGEVINDRTVLGMSTGILLVAGVDKFNIGMTGGVDIGFGGDAKDWIYQGKPWVGFVIGIDFIK